MELVKCGGCKNKYVGYEDNFHRNASTPHGYNYRCKSCVNDRQANSKKEDRTSLIRSKKLRILIEGLKGREEN